jgi:nicotinate-nucleotide adenylyltransferase
VRTGVFGGTFDPPHIGHLIAAQDAREALQLDRVLFVPAAEPPHKLAQAITDGGVRLRMLEAAIADNPAFEICDVELKRQGPSYTVDTLLELEQAFPGDALFLLIGADQAGEFSTWREPEIIARLATVVPLARAGVDSLPALGPLLHAPVRVTRIDVSASEIRGRLESHRPIRYMVPPAVEQIIREYGLYTTRVTGRR